MAIVNVNNFHLDVGAQEVLGDIDAFLAGNGTISIDNTVGERGAVFGALTYDGDVSDIYKIKLKSSVPLDTVVQYDDGGTLKEFGTLEYIDGGYYQSTGAVVIENVFNGIYIYQEENASLENMIVTELEIEDTDGNSILTRQEDDGIFDLPRKDWYDEQGRIYKDALIDNFNAIEAKLKELAEIGESMISGEGIDTSDVHLDDVTMDDDPSKILNFKSYLDVVNMKNFPIECEFSGVKLVKLAYYNNNYEYKTITNKKINCNNTNRYIYFNYINNTVAASNATTSPANSVLIGCYCDGVIKTLNSFNYTNINVLYYLSRMSERLYHYRFSADTRDQYNLQQGITLGNRCIGGADTNSKTGTINHITFRDVGV